MFRRWIRDYLSLTCGERRGLHVLSTLVLVFLVARILIPGMIPPPLTDVTGDQMEIMAFFDSLEKLSEATNALYNDPRTFSPQAHQVNSTSTAVASFQEVSPQKVPEPFPFDPNAITLQEIQRLGVPYPVARTWVNYRNAGAKFKQDSDLLRIYGLDAEIFHRLENFIRIEEGSEMADISIRKRFELNHADSLQLISVYGIGPVFAGRILRYRESLGGFHDHQQLLEVYGLGREQFDEMQIRSYVDTSMLKKLDLNLLEADVLSRHPYLDRYQSDAIVACRELTGPFRNPEDLVRKNLIADSVYRRLRPYLVAGH
jgi:DNA uptake protein ComE-like DNA-binding protein